MRIRDDYSRARQSLTPLSHRSAGAAERGITSRIWSGSAAIPRSPSVWRPRAGPREHSYLYWFAHGSAKGGASWTENLAAFSACSGGTGQDAAFLDCAGGRLGRFGQKPKAGNGDEPRTHEYPHRGTRFDAIGSGISTRSARRSPLT